MINYINNFLSNLFGNTEPVQQPVQQPGMRKVSDTSKLTLAQLSLVEDSLKALLHARSKGYPLKTRQDMADDFNKLFRMDKSHSAWRRIFVNIEKKLNEAPQE